MALTVEAVYENGVLKPAQPLPLPDKAKVQVTLTVPGTWAERTYGIIGWKGSPEQLDRLLAEIEAGEE